jgi:antitoxin component of MazEF toxin-antitoxin module
MGCPTKVQSIKRKKSEQWYINFPSAVAQAMEFQQSEEVEWIVSDKKHLILKRENVPADPIRVKKK